MGTPKDSRRIPRVVIEKADTPKVTFFSHDWADKTSWYECAVRVVGETATRITDTTYQIAHSHIIDTYHGKITGEDFLEDSNGNSFRVELTVNAADMTEQDPHLGSGGDFTLDYVTGIVTFLSPLNATDQVLVTYHYATSSLFTLKPVNGRLLSLEFVECQFSADVVVTDSVTFQAYGNLIAFAPELAQSNGGPYPDAMKIPLGKPVLYKGMRDFINEAVRSYVQYPVMGGASWRGVDFPILVFDWDYSRATAIRASMGMEIQVRLQHDIPFGGSMATATFYCSSEEEET